MRTAFLLLKSMKLVEKVKRRNVAGEEICFVLSHVKWFERCYGGSRTVLSPHDMGAIRSCLRERPLETLSRKGFRMEKSKPAHS